MKKKLLFCLFSIWSTTNILAQSTNREILSSAGEFSQGNSMLIDWTLGELSINTIQSPNLQVSQGFHQPNFTITSINELPPQFGAINIFPNPSADWVKITCTFDKNRKIQVQLLSITGELIWQKDIAGQQINESISLNDLSAGTYLLNVLIDENQYLQSNKILKIN